VLVVGGQEGEHVVAFLAAEEPDQTADPVRGDYVNPFIGRALVAEELADPGPAIVAGDPECPVSSTWAASNWWPRSPWVSRKTTRRTARPGRG